MEACVGARHLSRGMCTGYLLLALLATLGLTAMIAASIRARHVA
jgi:hypothetical protein